MMKPCFEVKICGLTRVDDVVSAVQCGCDFVGFVLVPASRRYVPESRLAELANAVSKQARVRKVGVFQNADLPTIQRMVELGKLDIIQLHGSESPEFAQAAAKYGEVWKAVTLRTAADVEFAAAYPAQRIVCDGAAGGSGELSNWALARQLVERGIAVMLAGGITPENARWAWQKVGCCGLDLASGVEESIGMKSAKKLNALWQALNTPNE